MSACAEQYTLFGHVKGGGWTSYPTGACPRRARRESHPGRGSDLNRRPPRRGPSSCRREVSPGGRGQAGVPSLAGYSSQRRPQARKTSGDPSHSPPCPLACPCSLLSPSQTSSIIRFKSKAGRARLRLLGARSAAIDGHRGLMHGRFVKWRFPFSGPTGSGGFASNRHGDTLAAEEEIPWPRCCGSSLVS
jgi:hypothetical protein